MVEIEEEQDAKPYFSEQYTVGQFLIRVTKGQHDWFRFQAGRNVVETRNYVSKAMMGRGFHGDEVLYHLLGFGATEEEAISMALNRK